jgi:hypothetical protein
MGGWVVCLWMDEWMGGVLMDGCMGGWVVC